MKSYLIVLSVALFANSIIGQDTTEECPTKADLEKETGYPKIVQLTSTTVSVDWSDLWDSLDWTSNCVEGMAHS